MVLEIWKAWKCLRRDPVRKKITGTTRPTGVYRETVYIDCCCSSAWSNKAVSFFLLRQQWKSRKHCVCVIGGRAKKSSQNNDEGEKMELNKKRNTRSKRHIVHNCRHVAANTTKGGMEKTFVSFFSVALNTYYVFKSKFTFGSVHFSRRGFLHKKFALVRQTVNRVRVIKTRFTCF